MYPNGDNELLGVKPMTDAQVMDLIKKIAAK